MTSRAASPFDANEEPPSKRARIQEEDDIVACLESLNDDCLLHALSYSTADDLNSFAICSRRCQIVRAHESLDQARTGITTISEGCTLDSLCEAIVQGNWDEDFQGNQMHAIIVRIERLAGGDRNIGLSDGEGGIIPRRFQLSGVTKLTLKSSSDARRHQMSYRFPQLFPNLREMDCSFLNIRNERQFCHELCQRCPNLNKVTWNGHDEFSLLGTAFRNAPRLADLCLNDCQFCWFFLTGVQALSNSSIDRDRYMLVHCRHLERLSIKNATWKSNANDEVHPVSQEMLIKMVRCHPTLRWLRSDLSEENVRMLKRERPEITFVSD